VAIFNGLADTIFSLREAKIKVWVLTGDKIETAINIGYSCKLLDDEMYRFIIDETTEQGIREQLKDIKDKMQSINGSTAIIVGGATLTFILKNNQIKDQVRLDY
jgi:phospholipid-transporting ATPase